MGLVSFLRSQKIRISKQHGFSLVELMVVVAIIGILASIAVPNYQRFQRKARQSGAKTELGGMYSAQKVFNTEWGFGTSCMVQHGYSVDGESLYNVGWAPASSSGDWNAANPTHKGTYNGPPCATLVYSTLKGGGGGTGSGTFAQVKSGAKAFIALNNSSTDFTDTLQCSSFGASGTCTAQTGCTWSSGTCSGTYQSTGLVIPGAVNNSLNNITFTIGAVGYIGGGAADAWIITDTKQMRNTNSGL